MMSTLKRVWRTVHTAWCASFPPPYYLAPIPGAPPPPARRMILPVRSCTRRAFVALMLGCLACCTTSDPVPTEVDGEGPARVVIDTRAPDAFAAGHRAGAINLQSGWNQLRDRVRAYVPDRATPIAVRAKDAREARNVAGVLAELGYTDVVLVRPGADEATLSTLLVSELLARLADDDPPVVIDVRTAGEWATGTIDGARLVEQDAAPALVAELDPTLEYAVICEGGYRSSQLASLLRRAGFERVHNVIDGMAAWRAAR
ncbi:MAG: rhodanese-like domain-containing protein, partial [Planctomycetota bacterium]